MLLPFRRHVAPPRACFASARRRALDTAEPAPDLPGARAQRMLVTDTDLLRHPMPTPTPLRFPPAGSAGSTCAVVALVLITATSCGGSSSAGPSAGPVLDTTAFEGPPFYERDELPSEPPGASTGGVGGLVDEPPPTGATNVPEACVITKDEATLVRQPVDIILLLDNSGSMSDELGAVEANINARD